MRPIRVIPPSGADISETVYHDEPNNYWVKNRSQIDATNWAESISYFDGLGRTYKAEEVNSQGNIFVEKEFDGDGRVLRVSNPFRTGETKYWTTNVYDESSRIKQVTLPDGATVKTDFGVSTSGIIGVTKQITDQAGKKRKGFSDALGRMVRVVEDPTGQNLSTDYVFDTLGNLRKTIQCEQSRYFTHASLGRLLYAKTTDAKGVYVEGTYDNFNRLKVRNYSDATPDVEFFYDGRGLGTVPARSKGKTTKVTSSVSETRYTSFNNLGQLEAHQQITDGNTYTTGYTYDSFGRMISETYPSTRTVKVDYNADGDVSSVWGTVGSQNRLYANGFHYNSSGAMERMRLGNGKGETYAYNERQQITEIALGNSATDKSLLRLEYGYGSNTENNGNLLSQKVSFNGLTNPFEQTYTYDSLNRLEVAEEKVNNSPTWKQKFEYDRYGNRRFDANNTTTLGSCSQAICNPLINTSDNRISANQGYSYDANGNVTQDASGKQFLYDAENHQKQVKDANNVTIGEYLYDGEGKRVKKISSTEITVFVYNAGGTLVAEYSTAIAQTPQVSYLTADHLGSARVITNQNGAVTTRKDYMAFGDEAATAQRTTNLNYDSSETRKGYTGYEKDTESGLEFAQARYYNSTHGRFTSVDPLTASASIRNPQTFNRYSYVLNSPYKFVDPLGLISSSTGACGSWCPGNGSSLPGDGGGYSSDYDSGYRSGPSEGTAGDMPTQQVVEESSPPPSIGRPVDADEITPTVGTVNAHAAYGGGAVTAVFDDELSEDATSIAEKSEKNLVAYTRNRDLALSSSKSFIDAIDDDNIEPVDDTLDLVRERSYGSVAKDGMVILPQTVTTGATSANASVSGENVGAGTTSAGNTAGFANTAVASQNKANEQRGILNDMNSPSSQDRQNFVNRNLTRGAKITFFSGRNRRILTRRATKSELRMIYDRSVTLGNHAAINQLSQNQ